jgi:hypothetical protein
MRSASPGWEPALLVGDLNLRSYEEFEAEARRITADSTVAEIEAMGGSAIGIAAMSPTTTPSTRLEPLVVFLISLVFGNVR